MEKSSKRSLGARPTAMCRRIQTLGQTFCTKTSAFWGNVWTNLVELCWGVPREEKKIVYKSGLWPAIAKCAVHVLPICTCMVVSVLNLYGYFIGVSLQGKTWAEVQSLDKLCLQIAAKINELLGVASLSVIIMDVLRYHLTFGDDGLPLGLLYAKLRYSDVVYLLSPDFIAGCLGFTDWKNRVYLFFGLVVCTTIAVLIGPSSAILINPQQFDAWPVGGVTFWLNGDLAPTSLDSTLPQYDGCSDAATNFTLLYEPDLSVTQCPWAGFVNLKSALEQGAYSVDGQIFYGAGAVRQKISLEQGLAAGSPAIDGVRTVARANNLAIGNVARFLAQEDWCDALQAAPQTGPLGYGRNYKYAVPYASIGIVHDIQVPVIRAQCSFVTDDTYHGPDIAADGDTFLPFPIILDYAYRNDLRYYIPVAQHNASRTNAYWVPVPTGPSPTSYGAKLDRYPSAFLVLRHVLWSVVEDPSDITCSAEINWSFGFAHGTEACAANRQGLTMEGFSSDSLITPDGWIFNPTGTNISKFEEDPLIKPVELSKDWLDLLTPTLQANETGWTTLASTIDSVLTLERSYNSMELNSDIQPFMQITAVLASFLADGITRLGIVENNVQILDSSGPCLGRDSNCAWDYDAPSDANILRQIIDGTAKLVPGPLYRTDTGRTYRFYGTISGYGISSASLASKLSLALLFFHVLLATVHICYTIWKRDSSQSWSSPTDILALSRSSKALINGVLRNTSAGIKTTEARKLRLRIRDDDSIAAGEERLQLLVGNNVGDLIQKGRAYGQK